MIKVTLLLACLLAAVIIYTDAQETTPGCLYEDELWGGVDGTKFYFCFPGIGVIEQSCPPDTFFVRNDTASGCIPTQLVASNCVYNVEVGPCTGQNVQQPQPSNNPTQFYLCPAENATPVLLDCAEGKAFVKQDGYLGCFNWTTWRQLRDCEE